MYKAVAEDLTNLGGPMGTEYTTTIFRKYFKSRKRAKEYCEKHYRKHTRGTNLKMFKWLKKEDGDVESGDLRFVSYGVYKVKTED